MTRLIEIWNNLSDVGLNNSVPSQSKRNVRLTNQISIITCFIAGIYAILFLKLGLILASSILIPACIGLMVPLALNYFGYYILSRLWLVVWCVSCVVVFSFGMGINSGTHFTLFAFFLLPWIIFDKDQQGYSLAGSIIIILAFVVCVLYSGVSYWGISPTVQALVFNYFLIVTFLLLSMFLTSFFKQYNAAEKLLQKRNSQLEEAQRLAKVGSWEWDLEKNNFEWSNELFRIMGLTRENFTPSYEKYFDYVYPEDIELVKEQVEKAISNQEPIAFDHRIIRADGEIRILRSAGNVISDENGAVVRMSGTSQDVTEAKESEVQFQKMNQEQQEALHIVSEQNKRLLNFAHIVSHNLRSHSGNFKMLLDLYKVEEQQKEKDELIKLLVNASDQMMETIHSLSDIVTVQINIQEQRKKLNLRKTIDGVLKSIVAQLKHSNAEVEIDVPDNLTVNFSLSYLESILLNLITNCLKYAREGVTPHIVIRARNNGTFTELEIEDNGKGIDLKRYGNKIFGMYNTFHGNKDARGIGLFIVKNQVEAMGGSVSVESTVGKGSTFKVSIK